MLLIRWTRTRVGPVDARDEAGQTTRVHSRSSAPKIARLFLPGLQVVDEILDADGSVRLVRLEPSKDCAPHRHAGGTVRGGTSCPVPDDVEHVLTRKDAAVPACQRGQIRSRRVSG